MILVVVVSLTILPTVSLAITIYDVIEHWVRDKRRPPFVAIRRLRSLSLVSADQVLERQSACRLGLTKLHGPNPV